MEAIRILTIATFGTQGAGGKHAESCDIAGTTVDHIVIGVEHTIPYQRTRIGIGR